MCPIHTIHLMHTVHVVCLEYLYYLGHVCGVQLSLYIYIYGHLAQSNCMLTCEHSTAQLGRRSCHTLITHGPFHRAVGGQRVEADLANAFGLLRVCNATTCEHNAQ